MAADDELPRGLTLTATVTGTAAAVTFPAAPGISWVLTHVDALAASNSGAIAGTFNVQATAGGSTLAEGLLANDVNWTVEEWTWDGKDAAPIGQAITILFNSG